MALQEVLDVDELADEVLRYCNALLRVFTGSVDLVSVERYPSAEFNALVEIHDRKSYRIWVYDGLIARLRETLERMHAETIHDEILDITESLLGDRAYAHISYRVWLVQSIIFVVLHELGHAMCGHLAYLAKHQDKVTERLALAEVRGLALVSDGIDLDSDLRHLFELEADEFAVDRMLVLAHEFLLEDVEAREIFERLGRDVNDVDAFVRRKSEELSFYAACTSIALIEAHGDRGPSHPLPFTRMLHMSNAYARRFLTKSDQSSGPHVVRLAGADRQAFVDAVIPHLLNAMDIVENSWVVAGVDLSDRFHLSDDGSDASLAAGLASDLLAILIGRPAKLIATEAVRYEELRQNLPAFYKFMDAYRLGSG